MCLSKEKKGFARDKEGKKEDDVHCQSVGDSIKLTCQFAGWISRLSSGLASGTTFSLYFLPLNQNFPKPLELNCVLSNEKEEEEVPCTESC